MSMTMREIVRLLHAGEVPPAPLNGKGERYSASTVKQIDPESGGCERRHWFEQVVGIEPPVHPAAGIGTRVHNHLQNALEKGKVLDVSPNAKMEERLAAKGLPHLPPHGTPGMHVERAFKMGSWPNGPEFTGTIDLMVEPEGWHEDAEGDFESAELLDHKTTGNYPKYSMMGWALSAPPVPGEVRPPGDKRKYLDDDVQCVAYSHRMLLWYPVPLIKATWVYYPKDGGSIVPVRADMERADVRDKWKSRILPLVEKMHDQHKQRPALAQVEANEEACGNYGGCPHKAYCVDYKGTGARTNMGKLSEKLMDEHDDEPKAKKGTKSDAPAMNPPPAGKSPFLGAEKEEKPKGAKKSLLADLDEDEPKAATSSPKTSEPASKPPASTTAGSSTKPSASPTGAGFALFLGCEPIVTKRPKIDFALFLKPIEERVAKAHKVADIALVQYEAVNHTVAALGEWLDENSVDWDGFNVVVPNSYFHLQVAQRALYTKAAAVSKATI